MKIETIKSIVLAALVLLSLVLTLGIWNFQPNYESLDNTTYINETNIGGTEETKSGVIQPSEIVFHRSGGHFALETKAQMENLYRDLQNWELSDFNGQVSGETIPNDAEVEVIFPESLPTAVLTDLFSVEEDAEIPRGSFDRMYVILQGNNASLEVEFVDTNNEQKLKASITNAEHYQDLNDYIHTEDQVRYTMYNRDEHPPIYLPRGEVKLVPRTYQATGISVDPLVNVLFNNPDVVRPNSSSTGGEIYTDGSRELRVFSNRKRMHFLNLSQADKDEQLQPMDAINQSLNRINDHQGWTDTYKLADINRNTIRYRLYNNHYPVFDNNGLTQIKQVFKGQDLYEYDRPLLQLKVEFSADTEEVSLPSGENVIDYIRSEDTVPEGAITDVTVGYKMEPRESSEEVYTLQPAWFIQYNNNWKELTSEDLYRNKGGG